MIKQFKQLEENDSNMNVITQSLESENNRVKLGVALGGLLLFLLTSNAWAACKGVDCACMPSEIQFASPVLSSDE